MARTLVALVVFVVAAACGDATVPGDGPVATTPSTVAPAPPDTSVAPPTTSTAATTTTTVPAGWGPDAARALFEQISHAQGWAIPEVALPDYAADACSRDLWNPAAAYRFGEALLFDDFLGWEAPVGSDEATFDAARFGWALGVMTCADRFPADALAAGPPSVNQIPACDALTWAPHTLPWPADPLVPDHARDAADGSAVLRWDGPDGASFTVTIGRADRWSEVVGAGEPIDDFGAATLGPFSRPGQAAYVVATDAAVTVAWERGPEHCSALLATLSPPPPGDPVDAVADIVLPAIDARVNPTELRMATAITSLHGFDHIGGEPSHGGGDAVHWMTDANGTDYFLYAIPVERFPALQERREFIALRDAEVAGAPVTVYLPTERDGLVASAVVDGFVIEATADLAADDLLTFMETWIAAWRQAGRTLAES